MRHAACRMRRRTMYKRKSRNVSSEITKKQSISLRFYNTYATSAIRSHAMRKASLQGHALALDLGDPRLHAVLGHLRLVVLVARQANELGAVHGLGLHVVVAIGRPRAHDVGTRALEARHQLVHGVAEVVTVATLVAQAKDSDLLALEVKAGEVAVDELVPRGARALGVGAGVPGGRADDDAIEGGDGLPGQVSDVDGREASLLRDVARNRLGVAGGGRVDQTNSHGRSGHALD